MKKKIAILVFIIVVALLAYCGMYAYDQANTLILQGEVDTKTVDLSSKVVGRVLKINVEKGDHPETAHLYDGAEPSPPAGC